MGKHDRNTGDATGRKVIWKFKKVASSTTLEESIENLKQNLFKIVDSLNARKSKYGKQVEQAIDHIKHHYSESTLSIEDVAMAYYNFYQFHPHIVEANLALAEGVLD